ncbi:MAG: GNAT family N-acetyltransferase [Bacillota bacterium]
MKYFRKISGDKVYLSPINLEDITKYTEWLNDLEIALNLGHATAVYNQDREKEALEELIKTGHNFAIVEKSLDELLGNCGLMEIDNIHRSAELGVFIGNKNYWHKGYGTEAIKLLLDYGFNILNLHNIMLSVYSYNPHAIACYQKIGFQEIGRRREAVKVAGTRYDEIFMDILTEEFSGNILKKLNLEEKRP